MGQSPGAERGHLAPIDGAARGDARGLRRGAQYVDAGSVVSVRDDRFQPVPEAPSTSSDRPLRGDQRLRRNQDRHRALDHDAAPSGSSKTVRTGDVHRNHIVVGDGTPVLLVYDSNDRFDLDGYPATLAAFEAELARAIEHGDGSRALTWTNYQARNTRPVTEYNLS